MNGITMNRRQTLASTAALGALALPAGAAVAAELPGAVDPLIALWAERQAATAAADAAVYEPNEDELVDRVTWLEDQIADTTPISLEGLAIVATLLVEWQTPDDLNLDSRLGAGLARHVLAQTPPDVLIRAGLEG